MNTTNDEPPGIEALTGSLIVDTCFVPAPGGLRGWLIYSQATGAGLVLAIGCFRPSQKKLKRIARFVGVAEVPPTSQLQTTLIARGPEGLRWNGRAVEVACH